MTKRHGLTMLAYGSALLLVAGTASAQQRTGGMAAGADTAGGNVQAGERAGSTGMQAGAHDPAAHYLSVHRAEGTIRTIDKQKGNVEIDLTNGESVKLNLPRPALQAFDDGDRVVVATQLAIAEDAGQAGKAGQPGQGSAGNAGGAARSGAGTSGGTTGGSPHGQGAGTTGTNR